MNTSRFRALLTTLMLAFAMSAAFGGCSSSEESSDTSSEACLDGGPRGDNGICCDVDPFQSGCPGVD